MVSFAYCVRTPHTRTWAALSAIGYDPACVLYAQAQCPESQGFPNIRLARSLEGDGCSCVKWRVRKRTPRRRRHKQPWKSDSQVGASDICVCAGSGKQREHLRAIAHAIPKVVLANRGHIHHPTSVPTVPDAGNNTWAPCMTEVISEHDKSKPAHKKRRDAPFRLCGE
jgi:hypothetical protein